MKQYMLVQRKVLLSFHSADLSCFPLCHVKRYLSLCVCISTCFYIYLFFPPFLSLPPLPPSLCIPPLLSKVTNKLVVDTEMHFIHPHFLPNKAINLRSPLWSCLCIHNIVPPLPHTDNTKASKIKNNT